MPDGKKYAINGPAGASEDEVIAAVQRRIGAAEPKTTFGGELKEAAKGIIPGAAGLLETAATGAAALLPEEQEMAVRAKASDLAGAAREAFKAAPGYEESIGRKFGEGLGSTAPFFALGPLGAAGRAGALGLGVGAGAGEARQRAETEGGEEEKGLATAVGAVIGASEAVPVFNFVKRLPRDAQLTMIDRVKRAFQAGGEEGAQEAAAQIGQNLITKGLYKPSQELLESAGEEGAYGAGIGGFIQVLTDMALGRRATTAAPQPPSAEDETEAPPAPPALPGTQAAAQQDVANQVSVEADLRRAIEDEEDERRFAMQERDEMFNQQYDADILREAAEAEALAPVDEDTPYYPPAVAPAAPAVEPEVVEPEVVEPEVVEPEPVQDVRTLALEVIKTTPTIKAISEATGLNQPKAAAIMRGFEEEGIVERKGNKFKLIEAAKPVEAKEEAAVETALAETVTPTTPPEAPRGTEPVTSEIVGGAGAGSTELPVSRAPAEGRGPAGIGTEGLGVPSAPAARVDEREAGVEPALTTEPAKNARAIALDFVRSTGKADAISLQKATGLKLSEVKVLRDALIGSGAIMPVTGKKNLYRVFEEYKSTAVRPVREEAVEETTDEVAIEAARDRATARMRAKNAEAIKAQERADEASERAPAPPPRPTYKDLPKGTLAEDTRRAFAALEAEEAAKKQPKEASAQQGLDLLGGMAKPSLSNAETQVLSDIKSAARFLNTSGQMNDQDRERYNAEIKKPKPDLVKLRKLIDKISSREPDVIGEVEQNEDFYTDREQYELDEDTYFYTERQNEYTRRGELKPLKFRRGESEGLPVNRVRETVSRIVKGWKNAPKIIVVQSVDEIPGQNFPNTQGVYVDGQVYLVADNLGSDAEVKATLFHESLGHFGLEQLFGKRLKEVLLNLYRTNKAVKRQADQYLERFPDTYKDASPEEQIALAVEEVLSELSTKGPQDKDTSAIRSAFNRVANLIRKFLNAMGFPVMYTNKEINEILVQAHGAVIAGQRRERIETGTVKYQRKEAREKLSRVFDGNPTAPSYNSKIGDGVRGALKNVGNNLRDGAISLMSIPQIADVWGAVMPAIEKLDILLGRRGATEMARREEVSTNVTKWFELSNEYKDKPEKLDMFFKVANMTTVYQVDPLNAEARKVLNKPKSDMTKFDRAAYDIISEFDKLDPKLRKAYRDLRKEYDSKRDELFALMEKRLGKDVIDRLKKKYDSKRLQVYLPLWRSGNYWLTYTDKNNETITSAYASEIDRDRATAAATADGGKNFQNFIRLRDARDSKTTPPTGFLGDVVREMEAKGAPQDMIDAVYETFLNYIPADSIRQQLQSREKSYDMTTGVDRYGVFGFEPDVFQAYANVGTRMANQLTNLEYAIPLEETMKELEAQAGGQKSTDPVLAAVYNNLEKQVNFIRYPEKNWLVDGASYFSYLWFIAGNISSALVNTSQLPLVVMPLLGGKYGPTKAVAAMDRAMEKYFNGGWDTNNAGKGAFPSDFTFGAAANIDPKYKKLYNAAVSRSVIRRSTGYEISELQKAGVKDYVGIKARAVHGLGWLFQNSERFNREVTLLAAFDLAYEKSGNVDKAIEEAIKLVNDAHGSALAETGPRLFQQGIGKVAFTFKRFAQAQIYLLSKLFKQAFKDADPETREVARSQLIGIFGSSFLIAGLQGMPLFGAVEFLANSLKGDDDEPYDFKAYLRHKFGETGLKGLLNKVTGIDIASRTGFNGMVWRDDPKRMSEVGPFLYVLEQAMGPAYGAYLSADRGYELFKEGEYLRSIEAITPSFVRNGFKAFRLNTEGARTKDGKPLVEDTTKYNEFMQLLGFTPSEVSAKREEASERYGLEKKLEKRRKTLITQFVNARLERDREGMQEARQEIRAFNKKHPMKRYFIGEETLYKSILDRRTRQLQSVNGLYQPPAVQQRVQQLIEGG